MSSIYSDYADEKPPVTMDKQTTPDPTVQAEQSPPKPPTQSRLRLIVLAGVLLYFVIGFGGHAVKLSTEDHVHSSNELSRAGCPVQPKALGKGNGFVSPGSCCLMSNR